MECIREYQCWKVSGLTAVSWRSLSARSGFPRGQVTLEAASFLSLAGLLERGPRSLANKGCLCSGNRSSSSRKVWGQASLGPGLQPSRPRGCAGWTLL